MKKLAASILGICSMVAYVHAQGSFIIDSSVNGGTGSGPGATTGGLVWLQSSVGGPTNLDTTTDINLGVLWGSSAATATTALNIDPLGLNTGAYASSGNWIASQATGQLDVTGYGSGALLDINGNQYFPPGQAAGTTIFLVLQGWTGNSATFAGATGASGQTAPFSIVLAANNSPVQPDVHTMGALVLTSSAVPEPSILALSGIGAAALMLVRRKK